jgi:hypothetical protein
MLGYYDRASEVEKVKPLPNEERHSPELANGQPELHIYGSSEDGWQVWLNTGVADHDGLCLAAGEMTRDEAIAVAVHTLEWAEGVLQGPPPRR